MAQGQIPVPRSYSQILGEMVEAFLSRLGLLSLKVGSPVLSLFETVAQSQLRASSDTFNLLEAVSLDNARGLALDRIGADDSVLRQLEQPATTTVSIGDSSFTKISDKIFQGTAAPIVGSTTVNVSNAAIWPAAGNVYLGRGSTNYEGPIAYTSILPPGTGGGQSGGSYYTLVLASGTLRYHNLGETVVLAQKGLRQISAGTIVQTPQGNLVNGVQFALRYAAQIQDGESLITGVLVVAQKPGNIGNVIAGAISGFNGSLPFTGATVTNPSPVTNGQPTENDDSYRERIRAARASRVRGTPLALQTASVGVTSLDENKRVQSASVVSLSGQPTSLFIDDGTGYEEADTGQAIESLFDSALGGERYAKLSHRPVAKAFLLSGLSAPFALAAGMQLAFTVGGVTTVHTFSNDGTFRSIGNATAYEVVASANANPALNWSLRTYAGGTQVAAFAKADTNESIQYAPTAVTNDANTFVGFALTRVDSVRLYKNDQLLNKDGLPATVSSNPFSVWSAFGTTEDLQLQVDGTPMANLVGGTYTFTAADFVAANTGFTSVGRNSTAAWAAVFNYRIPGITATVVNGLIVVSSTQGNSSSAKLAILGGSLVTKGMFAATVTTVVGANSDYVLDRNTGQIKLTNVLAAGDKLAAGSVNTRAFLQSPALTTVSIVSGAHLWFAFDGGAVLIPSGLTASTQVTVSTTAKSWGKRERVTQTVGTGMFTGLAVGDWAIFWDPASPADLLDRAFRVSAVDSATASWFEFDRSNTVTVPGGPSTLASAGLVFARTAGLLMPVSIAIGTQYTASSLVPLLAAALVGADVGVYQTTAMRINTATFSTVNGDVALVAADSDGQKLGLPVANATKNLTGHMASAESGNSDLGTPDFHQVQVTSASGIGSQPTVDWNADPVWSQPSDAGHMVGLRPIADDMTLSGTRYGNINGTPSSLSALAPAGGTTYALTQRVLPYETLLGDRWYFASPYALTPDDSFGALVDGDVVSKRFVVPMWRTLLTQGTTYASTSTYRDKDNGSKSLAVGFGSGGSGFDFNNYAVYMPARLQTHLQGDSTHYSVAPTDLTRTILWRYYRLGGDGNFARVRYVLPSIPNAPLAITVDNVTNATTDTSVVLASGAQKTGFPLLATQKIGTVVTASAAGVSSVVYLLGLPSSTAQRTTNVTTITVNVAAVGASDHNFQTGDTLYVKNGNGTYPDGSYVVTRVSANQFSYSDTGANAGPTAITGTVSYGTAESTLTGASPAVVASDILWVGPTTSLAANFVSQPMRIDTLINAQAMGGVIPTTNAVNTVVTWATVSDATAVKVYANAEQTATAVAAAALALYQAAGSKVPVWPTVIGTGAGVVDKASYAEASSTTAQWFNLADGINYVQTTTVPGSPSGDYQLSFKNPISAALVTNSDWANETVKIVPRTAKNVVDWFNAPAVSGLFTVSTVERSSNARKVQIASKTPGSAGSFQVQGGTANAATASVVGTTYTTNGGALMAATVTSPAGFSSGQWVSIQNVNLLPRAVFTSATVLQSIAANGPTNFNITISATTFYTTRATAVSNCVLQVEKQGNFWALTDSKFGTALAVGTLGEGDYVRVTVPGSPVYTGNPGVALVGAGNVGVFRVVRVVSSPDLGAGVTIWIENPSGTAQALAEANLGFFSADSVMVGDTLKISTSLWDGATSNRGSYLVVDVGNAGGGSYTSPTVITVQGPMSPVGSPAPALGTSSNLAQVIEGTVTRLIKQVLAVLPNQTNPAFSDVEFTTSALSGRVSSAAGSVITALDKLAFAAGTSVGVDGYRYATGLISEVNKVIYGDFSDTSQYPGVASAGATVNILGPLVRRIAVTLSLRLRSGASQTEVAARVQSAVAAIINSAGVGEAIALSDLTKAASRVAGVVSATMVSPVASAGSDLISVQPYEKPMVLNVGTDVTVTFVGN